MRQLLPSARLAPKSPFVKTIKNIIRQEQLYHKSTILNFWYQCSVYFSTVLSSDFWLLVFNIYFLQLTQDRITGQCFPFTVSKVDGMGRFVSFMFCKKNARNNIFTFKKAKDYICCPHIFTKKRQC